MPLTRCGGRLILELCVDVLSNRSLGKGGSAGAAGDGRALLHGVAART
jgi:hypothetical protein